MVYTPVSQSALAKILDLPVSKAIDTNGRIAPQPLPQVHHSIILRQLLFAIDPLLNELDIAQAFPSFHCTFGDRSSPIWLFMKKLISPLTLEEISTVSLPFHPIG